MDSLYIGIDNGTQGTKVCVFSVNNKCVISSGYSSHSIIENNKGRREQNPIWWIDAAKIALKDALNNEIVDKKLIKGISVSGQQHGCVVLDENGNVLRNAKLWCDTETVEECDIITNNVGGKEKVINEIGNSVAVGFTASKILWIKRNEPEIYEKIKHILLPHDYLNYWLTGNYVTDMGDASGTAYFDIKTRNWSKIMLKAIDDSKNLEDYLPKILKFNEKAGVIRKEISDEFGIPNDVIVASGGGDNMMSAIGTGNVKNGIITCSLGTSGTIFSYSDKPIIDNNGELASFCSSSGGWLPLICTMNVTIATEQMRSVFGLSIEEYNKKVEEAKPGSDGIILIPYFNGERTPPRPNSNASFVGITTTNFNQNNLCRAAMEGATFGLKYGIEILERLGIKPKQIRLVGGGSKSKIWRQIVSDIFDCEVVCPNNPESGSLGCAIQAMSCVTGKSIIDICEEIIKIDNTTITQPIQENVIIYKEQYKKYLKYDKNLNN